ncbi:type I methionyl aminopeptidase, partial [Patescibacteria group bacterium]|nr:type I methionyl aminopeptidase [Patescibacteria group bacterium]
TFPSNKHILNNGDLINVDCGVIYGGLHTDSAFTEVIGNKGHKTIEFKIIAYEALFKGIEQAKVGNKVGAIGEAIQKTVEKAGYSIIKELIGHGVGENLHEEPQVPNYGSKNNGPILKENMTIAIEPIISMGNGKVKTLDDKWSIVTSDGALACQAEHTVLISKNGPEILTQIQS